MRRICCSGFAGIHIFIFFSALGISLSSRTCGPDTYKAETWSSNQFSLSVGRSDFSGVQFRPGIMVLAGGRTSITTSSNIVDVINTVTNQTVTLEGLSEARHFAAGVTVGSQIIIAGGYAGGTTASNTVDILNLSETGSLIQNTTASLSVNRSRLAIVAPSADWVLFAGGTSGVPGSLVDHGTVDVYNVKTNTWSVSTTPLSKPRYSLLALAIDNETVLFAGGGSKVEPFRDCEVFALNRNNMTWALTMLDSPLIHSGLFVGRYVPAGVMLGGKAIIAGGLLAGGLGWSKRVDFFDITKTQTDSFRWQSSEALSAEHVNIAGTVMGTLAIFAGGTTADIYDSITRSWRSVPSAGVTLTSAWLGFGISQTTAVFTGIEFSDRRVFVLDLDGCSACPSGSTAAVGSTRITNCTCLPGMTGADGTPCTCCNRGQYKAQLGSAPCSSCPANSLGSIQGSATTPECNALPNKCCRETLGEVLISGTCGVPSTTTPTRSASASLGDAFSFARQSKSHVLWAAAAVLLFVMTVQS